MTEPVEPPREMLDMAWDWLRVEDRGRDLGRAANSLTALLTAIRAESIEECAPKWLPIETAPKDGRWLLAVANDGISVYRISWGRSRKGDLCWCSADYSFGDGLFSPNGGWTEWPALRSLSPNGEGK